MSRESAKDFVEKFYTDDEFLKTFYKKCGLNKKATSQEKTEMVLKTSKEMGFDFTNQEYLDANKDYFKGKGFWKTIKIFIHITKMAKVVEKEKD